MYLVDIISAIVGIIITIMITANNELSNHVGVYSSSVVIHVIGVLSCLLFISVMRKKITGFNRTKPYQYLGGAIGVLTVVFSNITIPELGVSLVVSLGLLGQIAMSVIYDSFGIMGSLKSKLTLKKIAGVAIMAAGIAIMLYF